VLYARVSTHDQRKDLDTQAAVLEQHANGAGYNNCVLIRDLGSGLNYRKRGLNRMLSLIRDGRVKRVVLLRRDRLLRFGTELFFTLCSWHGVEVVLLDEPEESFEQSLVKDVLELMTVFAARLHGSRSHANRRKLRTA
jgi:predicted site-specific integrase-resolvase